MIEFNIEIADYVFTIKNKYSDTKELCKDYLSKKNSEYVIEINDDDIAYEKDKSEKEAIYEGRPIEEFSDAYLETIAVYRKIAEYIANDNATVFHGSLIALNKEGYLFTGRSGIGKTTHVNNWLKVYEDTEVINGDKPILKIVGDDVIGYGTPWSGKENLNCNKSIKVKAIILVSRDTTNHIEEIKISDCISNLLSQTYRSSKNEGIKNALELSLEIAKRVKLYKLSCNMEKESAKVAYEGINK